MSCGYHSLQEGYLYEMKNVLKDKRGISRLVWILILAVVIMAVICAFPLAKSFKESVDARECAIAKESAQKKLDTEFLSNPNMTPKEAIKAATSEVRTLADICPGGGHVHIVKDQETGKYTIVCDLHDAEK